MWRKSWSALNVWVRFVCLGLCLNVFGGADSLGFATLQLTKNLKKMKGSETIDFLLKFLLKNAFFFQIWRRGAFALNQLSKNIQTFTFGLANHSQKHSHLVLNLNPKWIPTNFNPTGGSRNFCKTYEKMHFRASRGGFKFQFQLKNLSF